MMGNRVLFIVNVMSHYQIPLFEKVAEMCGGEIDVVSVRDIPEDRRRLGWGFDEKKIGFSYSVLKEYSFGVLGRTVLVSPGIFKSFMKNKYDVVFIGGYYTLTAWISLVLAKLNGCKLVLRVGTHYSSEASNGWLARTFKKIFFYNIDDFVVYGRLSYEYLCGLGVDEDKIFIEYNTVDVAVLRRLCDNEKCLLDAVRSKWKSNFGLSGKVVLYVGQLINRKNIITLLYSAQILARKGEDVSVVIVGNGPEMDVYEGYVQLNGLSNVVFVGAVPADQVVYYYMAADIFALISINEVYGLVVNEAMCFGCPIVVSRNCGASADLVDGNGFVIDDPLDAESVVEAILRILSDDRLYHEMSARSYEIIRQYDVNNAASVISSVVE